MFLRLIHFLLLSLLLKIYLLERQNDKRVKGGERKRNRSLIHWLTLQMPTTGRPGPGRSQTSGTPPSTSLEAVSEAGELGLEPGPVTWDARTSLGALCRSCPCALTLLTVPYFNYPAIEMEFIYTLEIFDSGIFSF